MANLGPAAGGRRNAAMLPTPPKGEPIASYGTYAEAQRAVDHLADKGFPVQHVTIVGTGLQMVERVTGRLTYSRVALAGAASGAWFGLFVGLLLSLFTPGSEFLATVLTGVLIGAAFGILFGVLSYSFTGGRRDFTSMSQIVASEYVVLCAPTARAPRRGAPRGRGAARPPRPGSRRRARRRRGGRARAPRWRRPWWPGRRG